MNTNKYHLLFKIANIKHAIQSQIIKYKLYSQLHLHQIQAKTIFSLNGMESLASQSVGRSEYSAELLSNIMRKGLFLTSFLAGLFAFVTPTLATFANPQTGNSYPTESNSSQYIKFVNVDSLGGDNFWINPVVGSGYPNNYQCRFRYGGQTGTSITCGSQLLGLVGTGFQIGDDLSCKYDGTDLIAYINDVEITRYACSISGATNYSGVYSSNGFGFDSYTFTEPAQPTSTPTPTPTSVPPTSTPTSVPPTATPTSSTPTSTPTPVPIGYYPTPEAVPTVIRTIDDTVYFDYAFNIKMDYPVGNLTEYLYLNNWSDTDQCVMGESSIFSSYQARHCNDLLLGNAGLVTTGDSQVIIQPNMQVEDYSNKSLEMTIIYNANTNFNIVNSIYYPGAGFHLFNIDLTKTFDPMANYIRKDTWMSTDWAGKNYEFYGAGGTDHTITYKIYDDHEVAFIFDGREIWHFTDENQSLSARLLGFNLVGIYGTISRISLVSIPDVAILDTLVPTSCPQLYTPSGLWCLFRNWFWNIMLKLQEIFFGSLRALFLPNTFKGSLGSYWQGLAGDYEQLLLSKAPFAYLYTPLAYNWEAIFTDEPNPIDLQFSIPIESAKINGVAQSFYIDLNPPASIADFMSWYMGIMSIVIAIPFILDIYKLVYKTFGFVGDMAEIGSVNDRISQEKQDASDKRALSVYSNVYRNDQESRVRQRAKDRNRYPLGKNFANKLYK